MKSFVMPGVLLAALFLSVLPVTAQTDYDLSSRSKILALEHAWNQAESNQDLKAMDAIFDNSLVYVDVDGSLLTKAQFLNRVKSQRPMQVITESMTVEVYSGVAVVSGTYRARAFQSGKSVLLYGRFIDTWVYKNSVWVCVAAQSTPILH